MITELMVVAVSVVVLAYLIFDLDRHDEPVKLPPDDPWEKVSINEREYQLEQFRSMSQPADPFFLPGRYEHDYRPPDNARNAVMLHRGKWCLTGPWVRDMDGGTYYSSVIWSRYFVRDPHPDDVDELVRYLQTPRPREHRIRMRSYSTPTFLPYEGRVPV